MPDFTDIPEKNEIIAQGEEGEYFYIIAQGEVEVYKRVATGEKVQLRVLESGDHFGEIALLKDIPRTASVRTLTPCTFITFSREEFMEMIKKNSYLRESLEKEAVFLLSDAKD